MVHKIKKPLPEREQPLNPIQLYDARGRLSMKTEKEDTNESIVELIQAGNSEAVGILWTANMGLVAHIAKKYTVVLERSNDCDFDDLMQAGFIGMHRAAGEYSPDKGAKFSTYVIFHLKREMRRALGILNRKRDPSLEALSLDTPLYDDERDENTLRDTLTAPESDDDPIERDELKNAVRAAVGRIKNDTARRTIEAYHFEGINEAQQAETEGVSKARIGQRLFTGYRELYNDLELYRWAVDYDYADFYRHKGITAFNSSFSSVVEDIVLQAEEQHRRRAALSDALGDLM
jgi:RNA polymerase sigma factor (sigma-70 family)